MERPFVAANYINPLIWGVQTETDPIFKYRLHGDVIIRTKVLIGSGEEFWGLSTLLGFVLD